MKKFNPDSKEPIKTGILKNGKWIMASILPLLIIAILSCTSSQDQSKKSQEEQLVPIRAWQLHKLNDREDLDYIQNVFQLAPRYNINTIVFSHGMLGAIHDLYEGGVDGNSPFKGDEHGKKLNKLAQDAEKKGIKTWIWIHELEDIPDRFIKNNIVQLDDPKLYDFLKERYRKTFEDFPAFDGIMLTFHETKYKLFDDSEAVSEMSPSRRFAKITNTIYEVCEEFEKDMVVRTFVYTPEELEWARKGFSMTDPEVMIQSKTVPQDWQAFFPHNPVIGAFPDRRQIVEFDCSNEYTGKNFIPYTSPEYFAFRWKYDLKQPGVTGYNIRLDHEGYDALFTPNAINIYTISRLTQDSTLTSEQIWQDWTVETYGEKAAPHIKEALKHSFEIVNKAFFPLGFWFTKHSGLPEFEYPRMRLTGHTSNTVWWPETEPKYEKAPWWPDDVSKEAWASRQNTLMHPTPEDFERLLAEKDTAMILAEKAHYHLEKARTHISESQYEQLFEMIERMQLVTHIRKMHAEAYFGCKVLEGEHEVPSLQDRVNRAIDGLFMLQKITEINTPEVDDTTAYHQPPAVPWKTRAVARELRTKLNQLKSKE